MDCSESDSAAREAGKTRRKIEFGDFQTPIELAREACSVLSKRGLSPSAVLEPTCGQGNFLVAALEIFPAISQAVGLEINGDYVNAARVAIQGGTPSADTRILHQDFFMMDWRSIIAKLPDPLLVIGNPPWVTNSELGTLDSSNLPKKSNFHEHRGIEAITGKSNFDISEWMLIQGLEWIANRRGTMAMLCKTSVARKVLSHAWKRGNGLAVSDIYHIEASKHFGAAVDACFFIVSSSPSSPKFDCRVHRVLEHGRHSAIFGYRDGRLVANVSAYEQWKHLQGESPYKWRSGIKHDCAKVMEFRKENGHYRNGFNELIDLEDTCLYPLLKSSDIAKRRVAQPSRCMLVTQKAVGQDTNNIVRFAPKTWEYLNVHSELLDRRKGVIYKKSPRFSVFGVGEYSFAPWKVAISGFYKKVEFVVVGPADEKPVVLDDTCYFISCQAKEEAELLAGLLNSDAAKEFLSALIFWDAKRPITADVLNRLDIRALAREQDKEKAIDEHLADYASGVEQLLLFS